MSVFNTRPPYFSAQEAATLVQDLYGLTADASPLTSECDQNFFCNTSEKRYVLKISNPDEDRAVLEMQNACMQYIKEHDPSLQVLNHKPS